MKKHFVIWLPSIAVLIVLFACGVQSPPGIIPTAVPTPLPSPEIPVVPTPAETPADQPNGSQSSASPGEVLEIFQSHAGVWLNANDMVQPRAAHVAVALSDGRVLVAGGGLPAGLARTRSGRIIGIGGSSGGEALASAEIYDPSADEWTIVESMHHARINATVTLLNDGRVLVAGGETPETGPLYSAEIFDPDNATWTTSGGMAAAHSQHTATLLPEGRVLVTGGRTVDGDGSGAVDIFDPTSNSWSSAAPLLQGQLQENANRFGHAAILLSTGKVLISGGQGDDGADVRDLSTALLFDPESLTWESASPTLALRQGHTLSELPDGRILATGGAAQSLAAEIYDPASGEWESTGHNTVIRQAHSVATLLDGRVLLVGGRSSFRQLSNGEIYNPENGSWTGIATMAERRMGHTVTLLEDGRALVVGGISFSSAGPPDVHESAEIFDATR